jgi:hypothetical protein
MLFERRGFGSAFFVIDAMHQYLKLAHQMALKNMAA